MARFIVVLFEDGLQLIPSIWLSPDKKSCNWPPYINDIKIKKAINNEENPTKSWSLHKVLCLFGTLSIKLHYIICIPYYHSYAKITIRLKYTDEIYFKSSVHFAAM